MGSNKGFQEWQCDFAEFTAADLADIPPTMSSAILGRVRDDLNPSALSVFTKTALIHTLVGAVTLLFCPQFGLTLTSSHGLMPYLMKYGEGVCMVGCGALFTSVSLLMVSLALLPEEVRVLREKRFLQLAFLSMLSLGAILCLGGEVVLSLGIMWAFGAILGGAASLEAGWAYRRLSAERNPV